MSANPLAIKRIREEADLMEDLQDYIADWLDAEELYDLLKQLGLDHFYTWCRRYEVMKPIMLRHYGITEAA